MKQKIHFLTDSTADLPQEIIEEYNITVIPVGVSIGGTDYEDGVDIDGPKIVELVGQYNELPKTHAINPQTFVKYFKQIPAEDHAIFIGISSNFSGLTSNARLAAQDFDNITVIDGENLSTGTGILLMSMIRRYWEGMELPELIKYVEEKRPLVRVQFAINTFEYLHKGGRCSGTTSFFGTVLKIKPIIRVLDGKMVVGKKPRGKFKRALDTLLDYIEADRDNLDPEIVFVTTTDAYEEADYLVAEIKQRFGIDAYRGYAGAIITSHCGPKTIGILYMQRENVFNVNPS